MVYTRPLRENIDGQDGSAARVVNDHDEFIFAGGLERVIRNVVGSGGSSGSGVMIPDPDNEGFYMEKNTENFVPDPDNPDFWMEK